VKACLRNRECGFYRQTIEVEEEGKVAGKQQTKRGEIGVLREKRGGA